MNLSNYENGKNLLDSAITERNSQLTEFKLKSEEIDANIKETYKEINTIEDEKKREVNKKNDEELKKVAFDLGIPSDERYIVLKEGKEPRLNRILNEWERELRRLEIEKTKKENNIKKLDEKLSQVEENINILEHVIRKYQDERDKLVADFEEKPLEVIPPMIERPEVPDVKPEIFEYGESVIEIVKGINEREISKE